MNNGNVNYDLEIVDSVSDMGKLFLSPQLRIQKWVT